MRILAVLSLLMLVGCGPGCSDYSENIAGGNYTFNRTDSKSHWLFPTDKCGVGCPSIHRNIVRIRTNENVIAMRRQVVEEYECEENYISSKYYNLYEQYVIILNTNELVGPMNIAEYQKFAQENKSILKGIQLLTEENRFNGGGEVLKDLGQCTNAEKI